MNEIKIINENNLPRGKSLDATGIISFKSIYYRFHYH